LLESPEEPWESSCPWDEVDVGFDAEAVEAVDGAGELTPGCAGAGVTGAALEATEPGAAAALAPEAAGLTCTGGAGRDAGRMRA
jgi:hypothetical protein